MPLTRPKIWDLDTNVSFFTDAITVLHQGATSADTDVGFLFNRANGLVSNVALYWSESGNAFVAGFTSNTGTNYGNIVTTNYANIKIGSILTVNGAAVEFVTGAGIKINGSTGSAGQVLVASGAGGVSWGPPGAFTGGYIANPTIVGSNLVANSTTISSSTTTGALVVIGGVGVSGNINSGGYGRYSGVFDESTTTSGIFLGNTGTGGGVTPRAGFFNGNSSQNWQIDNFNGTFRWFTPGVERMKLDGNTGQLTVPSTVQSSSATTGALVVAGGAGIAGNLYVGGNLVVTNVTYENQEVITTTEVVRGNIVAASTVDSTSTTTGALVVTGGAGISGNVYSGNIFIGSGVTPRSTMISGNGIVLTDAPVYTSSAATYRTPVSILLQPTSTGAATFRRSVGVHIEAVTPSTNTFNSGQILGTRFNYVNEYAPLASQVYGHQLQIVANSQTAYGINSSITTQANATNSGGVGISSSVGTLATVLAAVTGLQNFVSFGGTANGTVTGSSTYTSINAGNVSLCIGYQSNVTISSNSLSTHDSVVGYLSHVDYSSSASNIKNITGLTVSTFCGTAVTTPYVDNVYGINIGTMTPQLGGILRNAPYAIYSSDPNARTYHAGNVTLGGNLYIGGSGIFWPNSTPYSSGSSYSNANVATFLAAFGSNTISTTGAISVGCVTVNGTTVASTTSAIQVSGDISLVGPNRSVLGNMYYQSGWKYAGNGYGWGFRENNAGVVEFMNTTSSNASGNGAVASPTYGTGGIVSYDLVNSRQGVGTSSPAQKLSIAGTLGISEAGSTGGRLLISTSASGTIINHNDNSPTSLQILGTTALRIAANQNVAIGFTTDQGYKLAVNGSFAATTKSFVIDHPTKPGKKLRYGSLEGPENGVYVRGRLTGNNTIELPEYWSELVDPASITVNLTPIGRHQNLYVVEADNTQVVVGNSNLISKGIDCYYTVYGERCDVDKLDVECD